MALLSEAVESHCHAGNQACRYVLQSGWDAAGWFLSGSAPGYRGRCDRRKEGMGNLEPLKVGFEASCCPPWRKVNRQSRGHAATLQLKDDPRSPTPSRQAWGANAPICWKRTSCLYSIRAVEWTADRLASGKEQHHESAQHLSPKCDRPDLGLRQDAVAGLHAEAPVRALRPRPAQVLGGGGRPAGLLPRAGAGSGLARHAVPEPHPDLLATPS